MTDRGSDRIEALFARVAPLGRWLPGLVVALLLLELVSCATLGIHARLVRDDFPQGTPGDPRQTLDVYADADWAGEYFEEFARSYRTEYESYTEHRRRPNFRGKYINLDERARRRTVPDCSRSEPGDLQVFFLGGSAVWGTGARDEATLPSLLARRLCDAGVPARVTNFGESGYTNTQELIRLVLELRSGNLPDVAIFYDGVNDVYSSYQNGAAGLPQNVAGRRLRYGTPGQRTPNLIEASSSWRLATRLGSRIRYLAGGRGEIEPEPELDWKRIDADTLRVLEENLRMIRALGREYGFHSLAYWQPVLYTKDRWSEDESTRIDRDEAFGERYRSVTALVRGSESIRDLSDALDAYERSVFIDEFHISEEANEVIAAVVFEDVMGLLRPTGSPGT